MTDAPNVLLPLIMATLSQKPLLSETQNNLLNDVKDTLYVEGIQVRNLKEKVDAAINTGKSLGILTVQNDEVRMPFLVNSRSVSTNHATGRSKSAPGSDNSQKRVPNKKRISNRNNEDDSDEDCRGKYRGQGRSRSRSRRRSRIHSKSHSKRSGRSRR